MCQTCLPPGQGAFISSYVVFMWRQGALSEVIVDLEAQSSKLKHNSSLYRIQSKSRDYDHYFIWKSYS